MSETVTEGVRRRLLAAAAECPTCHQPLPGSGVRPLADSVGINHTTLWRFMRGGDITGRNLDKVAAWLDESETRR